MHGLIMYLEICKAIICFLFVCLVLILLCSPFYFGNHLSEEESACCLPFLCSCYCVAVDVMCLFFEVPMVAMWL